MKILFIGDLFGKPGRQLVLKHLESLKQQHKIDVTIANGENSAGGFGITPDNARELLDGGVDLLTSGNHIWSKKEIEPFISQNRRLLRPHNMPSGSPGSGVGYIETTGGKTIGVLNLIGRVFVGNFDCPFRIASGALAQMRERTSMIIVDMHAETTSEKRALGWYLDGQVSAVLGTHTHVQTADEEILPNGTAYISDVGMTGPHDSVIGVEKREIIERFLTQMPKHFNAAKSGLQINGVILELDEASGKCRHIERLRLKYADHQG